MHPTAIPITVTAEHIASGTRRNVRSCPVAKALHAAGFATARVYVSAAYDPPEGFVCDGNADAVLAHLPDEVAERILAWDRGSPMAPFTFTFDPRTLPLQPTPA
jgi:hypothetical protein